MTLNEMLPAELELAKQQNLPLIIPAGNIEYHGPHCVCGCDTLIAEGVASRFAAAREAVIAPAMAYGPSSYAASGPELGTLNMDLDAFEAHVRGILGALLEGGWRNIVVLIHHQYDRELLFPMTLCYMKAARRVQFDAMERLHGRGWYARIGNDPTQMDYKQWIRVLPVMSREVQEKTGYDHAGRYECSLLMALYPDKGYVKPELARTAQEWFAAGAAEASVELGNRMIADILEDLTKKM